MPTRSRQHTAVKSGHAECWPLGSPLAATWPVRASCRAQVGELSLANRDGANQEDNLFPPFFYLTQRFGFAAVKRLHLEERMHWRVRKRDWRLEKAASFEVALDA